MINEVAKIFSQVIFPDLNFNSYFVTNIRVGKNWGDMRKINE